MLLMKNIKADGHNCKKYLSYIYLYCTLMNDISNYTVIITWIGSRLLLLPGLLSRNRRFLRGVEVGFLTTLAVGVGVRFVCSTPTPDVQLDHFLHHTPKLGIPIEMVEFLMKLLLKQRILAVYHDFH